MLSISVTQSGHCFLKYILIFHRLWHSQPIINKTPVGNLLLSSAILFSGGSSCKVLRIFQFMNCHTITTRTFMNHQRRFLQPAIQNIWAIKQSCFLEDLHLSDRQNELIVGGDGRCDSPGHCAKYGSYAMIDLTTNTVLDVQLVQVSFN